MDKEGKETGRVNPKKIKERKGMCILKFIVDQLGFRFFWYLKYEVEYQS